MANDEREQERDINYNAKIDITEAVRNLRDLERKVNKLGDMADQGQRMQKGFLSTKQVALYKRILDEMKKAQEEFTEKQTKMSERLTEMQEKEEFKKLKNLEDNLKRRTELLRNAEGGNKWGDVASPAVQEFHRIKQSEAREQLEDYKGSDEFTTAENASKDLEAQIAKLGAVLDEFKLQDDRATPHINRINDLRTINPTVDNAIDGASGLARSAGIITGVGAYAGYVNKGIDGLRQQEQSASSVTQKLDEYSGVSNSDAEHRELAQPIGEKNQYDLFQTLALQQGIAKGGITDAEKLGKDTDAIQGYSRAYGTDPNSMAEGGSLLRKMGALEEGQMDKLAKMIGGQVAKNSLGGREEEVSRATIALASTVSQGMDKLTTQGLESIVGLQTDVGSVKGMEGERGAATLANMDGAIKNSDSNFDLLLGKGTEFQTLEEMIEFEYQKEKGISDTTNVQRVLNNSKMIFGDTKAGNLMTESALAENNFLTHHEYRALDEQGILDKWEAGDFNTQEEVEALGIDSLTEKTAQWNETDSRNVQHNDAQGVNLNTDHSKAAEKIATESRGAWHDLLPDEAQHAILPAAGLGAGMLLGGGLRAGARRLFSRPVGAPPGGGLLNTLRGAGGSIASGASKLVAPLAMGAGMVGATELADSTVEGLFGHKEGDLKAPSLLDTLTTNPFKPQLHDDSTDGLLRNNTNDKKVEPVAKEEKKEEAVPTTDTKSKLSEEQIQTIEKSKEMFEDTESGRAMAEQSLKENNIVPKDFDIEEYDAVPEQKDKAVPADEIIAENKEKTSNEDMVTKEKNNSQNRDTPKFEGEGEETVIRIIIEGKIDGMNKENEQTVAKSVKKYFGTQGFNAVPQLNSSFVFDLSKDQGRS